MIYYENYIIIKFILLFISLKNKTVNSYNMNTVLVGVMHPPNIHF